MITPIAPPPGDMEDAWGGDAGAQAEWRERERRQRSVRLLMMFLLMLLLMDGEEQSTRRKSNDPLLRKRKNSKKSMLLDDTVYAARCDQDSRLMKVTRQHSRFATLVQLNNKINYETQIRKWADQLPEEDEENVVSNEPTKIVPDDEKMVWHYPWNSTGFYRGEWVREVAEEESEESLDDEPKNDDQSKNTQYFTTIELEDLMKERMMEMEEKVGVYLLPSGTKIKMQNYTATKADEATAEAVATLKSKSRSISPWLRVPELNEIVPNTEEEPPPSVPLTKGHGRAAFQFYSRSVSAMKELSLVDGFVKLYDSNTVGYSTRRDILLRVRGVIIHSIGRISLVSNASPGRSALIISDDSDKKPSAKATKPSEAEATRILKRRRLTHLVNQLDAHTQPAEMEQIRNHALDLFPFDILDENDSDNWEAMESFDSEYPVFSTFDKSGWFFDLVNELLEPSQKAGMAQKVRRRLSQLSTNLTSKGDPAQEIYTNGTQEDNLDEAVDEAIPENAEEVFINKTANARVSRRMREMIAKTPKIDEPGVDETSKTVFAYPYVPDDKQESIRKANTPAARRMPTREQMLEANAGRCEFEINLDVKETEWSLGEWKSLISHHTREAKQLDPERHKKEPEEGQDSDEEGVSKGAHLKRKHAESMSRKSHMIVNAIQDQALVLAMNGSIHSPNCDFTSTLNATAIRTDWEHTTGKAINYSFYMMLTCLAQIVVLLRQLLHTQHQSTATRVSLLCIGWQTVLDALLCLGHIYLSLAMQPLFTAFASVAFFKLLIFCVIEMKYMAIIIQARNNANGGQSTTEVLRRQVAMLHLRFYVALMAAFLTFFYAGEEYRTIYILCLYSFWVPQIIQNVITEAKRPLHTYYIYGMSVTRCVAPLYMFAVKNNFLKEVYPDSLTNYVMVEMLILWIGIQTAILIAQGKYGARFMIPARFLPPKFDYHRKVPPNLLAEDAEVDRSPPPPSTPIAPGTAEPLKASKTGGTRNRLKGGRQEQATTTMTSESVAQPAAALDCVICCNGIDHHNRKGYMLAPCEHIFHKDCLIQWMDVKMECPICRTELPPI